MKTNKLSYLVFAFMMMSLSACVTIIVNFPAEAAEEQIQKLIESIYNEKALEQPVEPTEPQSSLERLETVAVTSITPVIEWFVSDAQAAVDFSISSPAIDALRKQQQALASKLRMHFQSGAIGFTSKGLVAVHDISKVPPPQRGMLNQLVAQDNQQKNQLYAEIAKANGHPEWEAQVRQIAADKLADTAKQNGWWYQNASGQWMQ